MHAPPHAPGADDAGPWPDPWHGLLGPDVAWHAVDIAAQAWPLHPDEAAAVGQAMPRRQQEFAAGRHCAWQAQLQLHGHALPVPAGPDRAPRWPAGLVGSISHDGGRAVAAVALASQVRALGIDIDQVARFDLALAGRICGVAEAQRLALADDDGLRQRVLAMLFCVKEAVYKAQHPLTGCWLDFADLDVQLPSADAGRFSATLQRAAGGFAAGHRFEGRCAWQGGRCHAALVLRG